MRARTDRRQFLARQSCFVAALACGLPAANATARAAQPGAPANAQPGAAKPGAWPGFPQQDPALVRDLVAAAHGNLDRVRALVSAHPALANCAYDWGFGDWETPLGAAAHTGRREIAQLLLEHGARPDHFAAAMLGWDDVVRGMLAAHPALARQRGPHGIGLLAHARAGKADALVAFLQGIEGTDPPAPATLTDEERAIYTGEYTPEGGAGAIVIEAGRSGLSVRPPGGVPRVLTRTGAHTFHPAGAANVRIAFTVAEQRARRLEISEAEWFVSAVRA